MTGWNENDLKVIGKIQEQRSCKIAQAKEIYRKMAMQLADPDHSLRHEIIEEAFFRGNAPTTDDQKENAMPDKPKKQKKAAAAAKAKKPVAKKQKKAAEPRVKIEFAAPTREVELAPVGDEFKHVYTTNLFGNKKHAVVFAEYDNPKKTGRVGFNPHQLMRVKTAEKYAKANDLPVAYCTSALVDGKATAGFAVPKAVFEKFSSTDSRNRVFMSTSNEARAAYKENGWDDCKFTVLKAEAKAA